MILEFIISSLINFNILFIKLFQSMSSSTSVPKSLLMICQKCTNNAIYAREDIDFQLLDTITKDYDIVLDSKEPINSGMIAVVFKGKSNITNKDVAIKIAKKDIYKKVESGYNNLFLIYRILRYILYPFKDYYNALSTLKHFIESKDYLLSQCVFEDEIQTMIYMKNDILRMKTELKIKNVDRILVPDIYNKPYDNTFIVMEFINGTDIFNIQIEDRREYAQILVLLIVIQLFFARKFHTEPHPGNIICTNNGKKCINLIDFGMNINVTEELRNGLISLFMNTFQGGDVDYVEIINIFLIPKIDFSNYKETHNLINSIMHKLSISLISGNLSETEVLNHLKTVISSNKDFKNLKIQREIVQLLIALSCLNSSINILADYDNEFIKSIFYEKMNEIIDP